jgi:hypothetical protein
MDMRVERLNTIFGALLGMTGVYFVAAGPAATRAFGVSSFPPLGGATMEVAPEWRLVAFVRMFGVVLLLAGVILWAVGHYLRPERVRGFAAMVAGGSGVACVLAVAQQTALWNTGAGAALAILLGLMAVAYGWVAALPAKKEPDAYA